MSTKMSNADLIKLLASKSDGLSSKDKSTLSFVLDSNKSFSDLTGSEGEARRKAEELRKKKEAEAKAAEEEALKSSLGPNQFLLTDMTDGRLPKSGINHVMFRYPDGTWDKEHEENIPEADPFFHWDADILEALWLGYILEENVLAVGPPGTGKTSSGKQLCAWIRQPYARFNGKDGVEPAAFLGYAWATSQGMEWKDGLMAIAVANGYYTAIDEIFKLSPGIQMAMQSLYEKGGFLMLDEKPGTIKDKHIYPRKEFRILGTDNTKGTGDDLDKYPAGQMQDVSSIDRFGMTVEIGYMKSSVEREVLKKMYPNVDAGKIAKMVGFANLVREAFVKNGDLSLTLSLRGLSVMCKIVEKGLSLEYAAEVAYINKLGDDTEVRTCRGFISSAI